MGRQRRWVRRGPMSLRPRRPPPVKPCLYKSRRGSLGKEPSCVKTGISATVQDELATGGIAAFIRGEEYHQAGDFFRAADPGDRLITEGVGIEGGRGAP